MSDSITVTTAFGVTLTTDRDKVYVRKDGTLYILLAGAEVTVILVDPSDTVGDA